MVFDVGRDHSIVPLPFLRERSLVLARESLRAAKLLDGDHPQEFTIEMDPTSLVFQRGHRIRVDISSSNFPRFDVNPNTGEPLNQNRRWISADNAVYHDVQHPSRIILPIIPSTESSQAGQR